MLKTIFAYKFDMNGLWPRVKGEPRFWAMRIDLPAYTGWEGRIFNYRWFWERERYPGAAMDAFLARTKKEREEMEAERQQRAVDAQKA